MQEMTDEQLIKEITKGRSNAFEVIYTRYKSKVMGYIYSKVKNHETSEEIFQLVWEKVYRFAHKFDANQKFSTWLFTVSTNSVNDFFRKQSKQNDHFDQTNISKEPQLDNSNLIEKLDLDNLSSPYKEVLTLKYVDGFSTKEIAEKMSLTNVNVRKILSRGRNFLKKQAMEDM